MCIFKLIILDTKYNLDIDAILANFVPSNKKTRIMEKKESRKGVVSEKKQTHGLLERIIENPLYVNFIIIMWLMMGLILGVFLNIFGEKTNDIPVWLFNVVNL